MSPGRFSTILREQLEVSKAKFWECVRSGKPVDRPVPVDEPETVQHAAYVIAVLSGELHMPPDEIAKLSREEALRLVHDHWSKPR